MVLKFKPIEISENAHITHPEATLSELIKAGRTYDKYLQYQGFDDADGKSVYQGDVLELMVTDEIMDITKDGFSNSNLGKDLKRHPKVISVLCHIHYNEEARIGCSYEIYYMDRDRRIVNMDDEYEIDSIAIGTSDNKFPTYLCEKGAKVIANTVTATADVLEHIAEYTGYDKYTAIPEHAVMGSY